MTSQVSLEASEVVGNDWTEACASVSNEAGDQELFMSPSEMEALYRRLKLYYEQGVWSMGTVSE